MQVIGLKNCDTCRAALKALPGDVELRDVRKEPLSKDEISAFFAQFGDALVNKRSTTWRGLDEAERGREPVALLIDNPTLMKRPVILANGTAYLGWGTDVKSELLGNP